MWIALRTLVIGAVGALLAFLAGIPAPFLTGPAFLVTLSALLGLQATIHPRYRDAIFVVIGVNMGTSVTPEAVATAAKWPGSLAMLSLSILVIFLGGARLLRSVSGMDRMSALLTATPGHLSFVLSLSSDVKADIGRVTLIQTMRVLSLTLIVPFIAPLLSETPVVGMRPTGDPMTLPPLAALLLMALFVGLAVQKLRLPAALLLGGMAVSSVAHGFAITEGTVPPWLSIPAFVSMGTLIGTRFTGVSPRMVLSSLGASAMLTGFAAAVSLLGALMVSRLLGLPILNVLIAFAPGGLETMMTMSILLNANPAYVAAHHVFRLIFLSVVLPVVVARNRERA